MHDSLCLTKTQREMGQSCYHTQSFHACHLKVNNSHYLLAVVTEIKISSLWVPLNITKGGPNLFNHKVNICLKYEKPEKKKPRQNQLPTACKALDYSLNTKDVHGAEKSVTEIQKALKILNFCIYIVAFCCVFLKICKKKRGICNISRNVTVLPGSLVKLAKRGHGSNQINTFTCLVVDYVNFDSNFLYL